jgi:hypothetical protein
MATRSSVRRTWSCAVAGARRRRRARNPAGRRADALAARRLGRTEATRSPAGRCSRLEGGFDPVARPGYRQPLHPNSAALPVSAGLHTVPGRPAGIAQIPQCVNHSDGGFARFARLCLSAQGNSPFTVDDGHRISRATVGRGCQMPRGFKEQDPSLTRFLFGAGSVIMPI